LSVLTTGIPGYSAFSNLYLYGGVLTATVDGDEAAAAIPPPRSIMSGTKPEKGGAPAAGRDRWEVISDPELIVPAMGKRAVRVPGVTVSGHPGGANSSTSSTTPRESRALWLSMSGCFVLLL
jgi:hypothetical protein